MLLVEDGVQVDDTAIATQEGTLHTLLLLPVYTYWGVKVNVVMDRKLVTARHYTTSSDSAEVKFTKDDSKTK